jgi:hypothetical protein
LRCCVEDEQDKADVRDANSNEVDPITCAWRNVISSSTGQVTIFRSLYVVHCKGALNSGEAQHPQPLFD